MIFVFLISISLIQVLIFLGHLFLYDSFLLFFPVNIPAAFRVFFFFLAFSFVLSTLLSLRLSNPYVGWFYTVSVSWMGIFYFLFLGAVFARLSFWLIDRFHLGMDIRYVAGALFVLALSLSAYSFVNASTIRVARITVRLPNLPPAWQGKTAVFASDLHLGNVHGAAFADKVATEIQDLHPDLIFFGGDVFDGVRLEPDGLVRPLARLAAPMGKYFVTGNHEEFGDDSSFLEAIRNIGVRVLNDEKVDVEGVQLLGVDYLDTRDGVKYRAVLDKLKIDPSEPSILLRHSPFYLDMAEKAGINFEISGHTHEGQMFPANLLTHYIFKGYDYGLKNYGKLLVYTSSGVGTWGIPMRIGTRSEIVQITFEK